MIMNRKPTHPGEVLKEDILVPLGITTTEAAKYLGVSRKTLSLLLNGRSSMTPKMAVRIGKATNTSPDSWLYMQMKCDLWEALKIVPDVKLFNSYSVELQSISL